MHGTNIKETIFILEIQVKTLLADISFKMYVKTQYIIIKVRQ